MPNYNHKLHDLVKDFNKGLDSLGIPGVCLDKGIDYSKVNTNRPNNLPDNYVFDSQKDVPGSIFDHVNCVRTKKEEDMGDNNPRTESDWWTLYHVIAVNKANIDNPDKNPVEIDRKVVAKNKEHAKGLAHYYRLLETKEYDNTKISVKVTKIMDIKPVEKDEEE